jgi:nucleoside-diphosphate-sugar epimerase
MSAARVPTILVTGSHGLIGTALSAALRIDGWAVRGIDVRAHGAERGDVCVRAELERALAGCDGVVHLAAVSRVIDGERDPARCWAVNAQGTRTVVDAALASPLRPWVIYASSREVYGQPQALPASEACARAPVNIYGRSKVAAEDLVAASGLAHAIVRFSNVYGATRDHADRVVPAFARQAALGLPLRVDGRDHTFDFTHLSDTVRGVMAVVKRLQRAQPTPPIHFVTGRPTTLGALAAMAVELSGSTSVVHEAPPRSFDVHAFHGDPARGADVLGWRAEVSIRDGLARLIEAFRQRAAAAERS